jgi:hypothetical protein
LQFFNFADIHFKQMFLCILFYLCFIFLFCVLSCCC